MNKQILIGLLYMLPAIAVFILLTIKHTSFREFLFATSVIIVALLLIIGLVASFFFGLNLIILELGL